MNACAWLPGALHEADVRPERVVVVCRVVRAARAGLRIRKRRKLAPRGARRRDRRERPLALQWPEVGDQQREPRRLLDVGLLRDLCVEPGRIGSEPGEPARGEGDLAGEALGVSVDRSPGASGERLAVVV